MHFSCVILLLVICSPTKALGRNFNNGRRILTEYFGMDGAEKSLVPAYGSLQDIDSTQNLRYAYHNSLQLHPDWWNNADRRQKLYSTVKLISEEEGVHPYNNDYVTIFTLLNLCMSDEIQEERIFHLAKCVVERIPHSRSFLIMIDNTWSGTLSRNARYVEHLLQIAISRGRDAPVESLLWSWLPQTQSAELLEYLHSFPINSASDSRNGILNVFERYFRDLEWDWRRFCLSFLHFVNSPSIQSSPRLKSIAKRFKTKSNFHVICRLQMWQAGYYEFAFDEDNHEIVRWYPLLSPQSDPRNRHKVRMDFLRRLLELGIDLAVFKSIYSILAVSTRTKLKASLSLRKGIITALSAGLENPESLMTDYCGKVFDNFLESGAEDVPAEFDICRSIAFNLRIRRDSLLFRYNSWDYKFVLHEALGSEKDQFYLDVFRGISSENVNEIFGESLKFHNYELLIRDMWKTKDNNRIHTVERLASSLSDEDNSLAHDQVAAVEKFIHSLDWPVEDTISSIFPSSWNMASVCRFALLNLYPSAAEHDFFSYCRLLLDPENQGKSPYRLLVLFSAAHSEGVLQLIYRHEPPRDETDWAYRILLWLRFCDKSNRVFKLSDIPVPLRDDSSVIFHQTKPELTLQALRKFWRDGKNPKPFKELLLSIPRYLISSSGRKRKCMEGQLYEDLADLCLLQTKNLFNCARSVPSLEMASIIYDGIHHDRVNRLKFLLALAVERAQWFQLKKRNEDCETEGDCEVIGLIDKTGWLFGDSPSWFSQEQLIPISVFESSEIEQLKYCTDNLPILLQAKAQDFIPHAVYCLLLTIDQPYYDPRFVDYFFENIEQPTLEALWSDRTSGIPLPNRLALSQRILLRGKRPGMLECFPKFQTVLPPPIPASDGFYISLRSAIYYLTGEGLQMMGWPVVCPSLLQWSVFAENSVIDYKWTPISLSVALRFCVDLVWRRGGNLMESLDNWDHRDLLLITQQNDESRSINELNAGFSLAIQIHHLYRFALNDRLTEALPQFQIFSPTTLDKKCKHDYSEMCRNNPLFLNEFQARDDKSVFPPFGENKYQTPDKYHSDNFIASSFYRKCESSILPLMFSATNPEKIEASKFSIGACLSFLHYRGRFELGFDDDNPAKAGGSNTNSGKPSLVADWARELWFDLSELDKILVVTHCMSVNRTRPQQCPHLEEIYKSVTYYKCTKHSDIMLIASCFIAKAFQFSVGFADWTFNAWQWRRIDTALNGELQKFLDNEHKKAFNGKGLNRRSCTEDLLKHGFYHHAITSGPLPLNLPTVIFDFTKNSVNIRSLDYLHRGLASNMEIIQSADPILESSYLNGRYDILERIIKSWPASASARMLDILCNSRQISDDNSADYYNEIIWPRYNGSFVLRMIKRISQARVEQRPAKQCRTDLLRLAAREYDWALISKLFTVQFYRVRELPELIESLAADRSYDGIRYICKHIAKNSASSFDAGPSLSESMLKGVTRIARLAQQCNFQFSREYQQKAAAILSFNAIKRYANQGLLYISSDEFVANVLRERFGPKLFNDMCDQVETAIGAPLGKQKSLKAFKNRAKLAGLRFYRGEPSQFMKAFTATARQEVNPKAWMGRFFKNLGTMPTVICEKITLQLGKARGGKFGQVLFQLMEALLKGGCSVEKLIPTIKPSANPKLWQLVIRYGGEPPASLNFSRVRPEALGILIPALKDFPIHLYSNDQDDLALLSAKIIDDLVCAIFIGGCHCSACSNLRLIPQAQPFAPQLIYWLLHNHRYEKAVITLQNSNMEVVKSEWLTRALSEILLQQDHMQLAQKLIDIGVRADPRDGEFTKSFGNRMKLWRNRYIHPLTNSIQSAWSRLKTLLRLRQ